MNPWLGILLVLTCLIGLLGGCRYFGGKCGASPELKRKTVHMGMGLICTLFPLFFHNSWPVFLLAGIAVGALHLVRSVPLLKRTIGASLHGVERSSLGEIFFPVAIASVWFVSLERPLFYSLSVLVLTLADAFAALVGTQYGQQHYTTKEGYKTWEGSFIFLTVTFLCIHIPLLLLTSVGKAESLLIALLIGILVMIVEAVAWKGLDNLFIPLCVCIFLNVYEDYTAPQILVRVLFILCIIAFFFVVRSRSKLDDASILGASLILYIIITMGGWRWGVAPVVLFVNYLCLGPPKKKPKERVHNIYALLAVTVPGFIWLMLHYRFHNPNYLFFYYLAYMAELICIYIAQWANDHPRRRLLRVTMQSSLMGLVMIMGPYFLLETASARVSDAILSLGVAVACSQLFRFWQPEIRDCPVTWERFIRQGSIGVLASVLPWCARALF